MNFGPLSMPDEAGRPKSHTSLSTTRPIGVHLHRELGQIRITFATTRPTVHQRSFSLCTLPRDGRRSEEPFCRKSRSELPPRGPVLAIEDGGAAKGRGDRDLPTGAEIPINAAAPEMHPSARRQIGVFLV